MNEAQRTEQIEDDIRLDELLPWIEFGCWTAIVLFPFLYWVNGPAVSTDQYVMRNILIVVAVSGAFGLRFWNWRARRRVRSQTNGDGSESVQLSEESAESPQ
jgi:hypothetical protein